MTPTFIFLEKFVSSIVDLMSFLTCSTSSSDSDALRSTRKTAVKSLLVFSLYQKYLWNHLGS